MKNLKNFAFGLLVAVLAVGFSAFKPEAKKLDYIYQHVDGLYQKRDAGTVQSCNSTSPEVCQITTDIDMGADFEPQDLPEDWEPYNSSSTGVYLTNPNK